MFSITRRTTSVRQGGGSYKNGNMQEEANSFKSKAGEDMFLLLKAVVDKITNSRCQMSGRLHYASMTE